MIQPISFWTNPERLSPAGAAFLLLFSVVSLNVKFSNVLVIGRSLQDGQSGVVDPGLASFRGLQDVLAV